MASRENFKRRVRKIYRALGVPLADEIIAGVRREFAEPPSDKQYKPFRGRNASIRNAMVERGLELNSAKHLNDTQRAQKVADEFGYSERQTFTIFIESSVPWSEGSGPSPFGSGQPATGGTRCSAVQFPGPNRQKK